jgi:hypothetical protein
MPLDLVELAADFTDGHIWIEEVTLLHVVLWREGLVVMECFNCDSQAASTSR